MKKKELIFTYVILGILLVAITVGTLSDDFGNLIVLMPCGMFIPLIFNKINNIYKSKYLILLYLVSR